MAFYVQDERYVMVPWMAMSDESHKFLLTLALINFS